MKGIVNLGYYVENNKIYESEDSNLIVDGGGRTIVDILTASPSLSSIPSASAILDASNYTIQAIAFGKDPDGYRTHAHSLYVNLSLGEFASVKAASFESVSLSSYHGSATPYILSSAAYRTIPYKLKPKYPDPSDNRLERLTTAPAPGVPLNIIGADAGQNLNGMGAGVTPDTLIAGCYAPAAGVPWRILSSPDSAASIIASGTYYGTFNLANSMDYSGFVNMIPRNIAVGNSLGGSSVTNVTGLCLFGDSNFSSTGRIGYHVTLSGGDAGTASLYGGIYHMGLFVLDLDGLLQSGRTPPYAFSQTINTRQYRLFAKKTFNKDITYITDNGSNSGFAGYQSKAININWTLEF